MHRRISDYEILNNLFINEALGLGMAAQGAGDDRLEAHALVGEIFAQPHALAHAHGAQVVLAGGVKRSLAMAFKVECSHSGHGPGAAPGTRSSEGRSGPGRGSPIEAHADSR